MTLAEELKKLREDLEMIESEALTKELLLSRILLFNLKRLG